MLYQTNLCFSGDEMKPICVCLLIGRLDLNVLRRILKIWKCGCHGMDKFQVLKTPHDLVEVTLERLSNLTIGFLVASTTKQPDFRSLGHPNGLQEAHLVHSLK